MNFSNKIILITGAARGIGRATAETFARLGGSVAVHYHTSQKQAEQLVQTLPGKNHHAFSADLTDPHACESLIDDVVKHYGRLDVLVNNAGIYEVRPLKDLNYTGWQETWNNTLAADLIAPANLCFLAAQVMMKQKNGHIINISSRGAFRGEPDALPYGASKAGLNQLSQSLAQALAPYKIFVGVVAPGFVRTDMAAALLDGPEGEAIRHQSPLKRVATPREIAEAVVRLAADGMLYATGCILDVNGASYLRS
ncbi:MAG: SDR family oxidoreductase [Gammaproteobacteria bacterium]|nr:SDR family oxidoreductase [Gammaproteobacteria bacterium]MDE1887130.1 SDR family oxidoreductase [Gammaproteobacteria bacterium]MDE2139458.1 SDR family oxidoreductase [Gammaproteobacteria bacterium]MDE2274610.1 SDR family oxidoreductase [Gammaproteobacteria bacterium]